MATTGDNVQTPLAVAGTDRYDLVVGRHFCRFMAAVAPGPHCPSGGDSPVNRFFPAAGNHDHADGDTQNYLDYFTLPGPGTTSTSPSGSELYYDVVLGPVHLFVLDSDAMWWERHLPPDERTGTNKQRAWLRQAMRASSAPWKVVTLHHPPYGSSADYGSQAFAQLPYAEWGADLVLNGHAAVYERVHRDGITFVTNGLGGGYPTGFATPISGSAFRYNGNVATTTLLTATTNSLRLDLVTVEDEIIDSYELRS